MVVFSTFNEIIHQVLTNRTGKRRRMSRNDPYRNRKAARGKKPSKRVITIFSIIIIFMFAYELLNFR